MAKVFTRLDRSLTRFVQKQPMFFVATAPSGDEGHVNVSPKGMRGTFAVVDETTVAFLDLTGSSAETMAHLRQNGRICLMWCAFEGAPRVLRVHGRGQAHPVGSAPFRSLALHFPRVKGTRAIVRVDVTRVSTSCGYAVPRMDLVGEREAFGAWAERLGEEGLEAYRQRHNRRSIDDLEAFSDGS